MQGITACTTVEEAKAADLGPNLLSPQLGRGGCIAGLASSILAHPAYRQTFEVKVKPVVPSLLRSRNGARICE